jgi:hypothetical protein
MTFSSQAGRPWAAAAEAAAAVEAVEAAEAEEAEEMVMVRGGVSAVVL